MLVAVSRETVDKLNNDVFQTANGEAVNDVDNSAALHDQEKVLLRKASNMRSDHSGAEKSR